MSDSEERLPGIFKSKEFLEREAILKLEREILDVRHEYKINELKLQRELEHNGHLERIREISLKHRNINRSIENKQNWNDRRGKESNET